MKCNNPAAENLTNYIHALSGVETIAIHLMAHAMKKLGISDASRISPLPVDEGKEALFQACLSVLIKEGLLSVIDKGQGYKINDGSVKSIKELAIIKANLIDLCPAIESHITLLLHCAKSLPAVIAGKADGLQVLFPDGQSELVAATYRGNALQDDLNGQVAKKVLGKLRRIEQSSEHLPRVLEIGAGTCATTRTVMKAIDQSGIKAELTVSDISLTLVKDAESEFSLRYPFTRYSVLDIEEQNNDRISSNGKFDVIYAANVLHATSSIRPVIRNIVKLLRPGGLLIINELMAFSAFANITFGMTDGWWLFDDQRIPFSPLIEASKWRQILIDSGFAGITHYYPGDGDNKYTRQSIISGYLQ